MFDVEDGGAWMEDEGAVFWGTYAVIGGRRGDPPLLKQRSLRRWGRRFWLSGMTRELICPFWWTTEEGTIVDHGKAACPRVPRWITIRLSNSRPSDRFDGWPRLLFPGLLTWMWLAGLLALMGSVHVTVKPDFGSKVGVGRLGTVDWVWGNDMV